MKPNKKHLKTIFLLLFLITSAGTAQAAHVVASIKPIHSLVAGVMEGTGTPELLLRGNQSPHTFSLRPSDRKMLSQADLIFWIGEELETPMVRVLASLNSTTRSISLLDSIEPNAETEHEDDEANHAHDDESNHEHDDEAHHKHEVEAHADHHDEHNHDGQDPHIWLSVKYAMRIVKIVTEELSRVDPENAERYRSNSEHLLHRLQELDSEIDQQLDSVRSVPYVVFHDAYGLFEEQYGLNHAGAITVNPEQPPGARRLHELRKRIQEQQIRCVFSEPQFQPRVVAAIIEGTPARTTVLDPIGSGPGANAESYFKLMRNLANSFAGCLER